MVEGEEITNYMQILYQKQGDIKNIELPPNIVNKRIALYSPNFLKVCCKLEQGIYYINPYFYFKIMDLVIPKSIYMPKTKEVKEILEIAKQNKQKEDTYDFLYKKIVKYYNWGKREEEMNKNYFYKLFEDKKKLIYFYRYFDIPEKQWKDI